MNINEQANFIWSIADLLRGDFKQSEYGKVILPFTVLRRFDCVLAPSKAKILEANKMLTVSNKRPIFKRMTGHDYYNISQFDFEKLMDDSNAIEANLRDYINGFSEDVREIMDNFEIFGVIDKLSRANLLYLAVQRFAEIDMSDTQIDNLEMGYMFEELIRRFSEQSNETAGEHFTPREVIELMVEVLLDPDMDEIATTDGKVITILDPACGTGGMLSVAQNKMQALNATTKVIPFGQELNPETYATCRSDMILKGNSNSRIVLGNSFNEDGFKTQTFDYMLSNPPFGVEWKKVEKFIRNEAASKGYNGRFGAGLPRISDGSLLFLQHLISKMNAPEDGGSRIGIVFNGSPMFSGDAGSGESEIRRWIIENDLLEVIIGLPDQLFYNTGITTYIWILTNRKEARRKGKVRLINGAEFYEKMRKGMGNKGQQSVQRELYVRFIAFGNGTLQALYDHSYAFYRRQLILTTKDRPADRVDDRFLVEKFKEETEGIFLWMLQGLHRLIENDFIFTESEQAKKNLEEAFADSNNIPAFLESSGYIRFEEGCQTTSAHIYCAYLRWCKDNLEKPLSANIFKQYLKQHADKYGIVYSKHILDGKRGYRNILVLINPYKGFEQLKLNPDIKTELSKHNFHPVIPNGKYRDISNRIIREAGCRVRKDSVTTVEVLITASPEFFEKKSRKEIREFFSYAVEFMKSKQNPNTYISAVVHVDEKTPHMHLCFVPITSDGRLSAKEIIGNKKRLPQWQDEFWSYMVKKYPDFERSESASLTGRTHIPPRLFKQAARLTRQKDALVELISEMNALNAKAKSKEIAVLLDEYIPGVEELMTKLKKNSLAAREMRSEIADLKKAVDRNKASTLRQLEQENKVQELDDLQHMVEALQKTIDAIPAEILAVYGRTEKERKETLIHE